MACQAYPNSGQHSVIAIRFSERPNFLKESINLAIRWRFQVFFHCSDRKSTIFLFPVYYHDLEHVHVSHDVLRTQIWFSPSLKSVNLSAIGIMTFTADASRHAVTLTFDPLNMNVFNVSAVKATYLFNVSNWSREAYRYSDTHYSDTRYSDNVTVL